MQFEIMFFSQKSRVIVCFKSNVCCLVYTNWQIGVLWTTCCKVVVVVQWSQNQPKSCICNRAQWVSDVLTIKCKTWVDGSFTAIDCNLISTLTYPCRWHVCFLCNFVSTCSVFDLVEWDCLWAWSSWHFWWPFLKKVHCLIFLGFVWKWYSWKFVYFS